MSCTERTRKGIGARLPRKEDARHLHGRASFVGEIDMPVPKVIREGNVKVG